MRRPETTRVVAPHRQGAAPRAPARSFASTLALVAPPRRAQAAAPSDHEPLAPLPYDVECAAKQDGLQRYWREHRLPGLPEPLIASPRPRGYRTSSKRRVAVRNGTVSLFLGDRPPVRETAPFVASPLEPAQHTEIYGALRATLNEPAFRLLAAHLHYLIIRGSYAERAVVLNVDALSGPLVRKIKMLAEQVRSLPLSALFVYLDPTRSHYHFESRRGLMTSLFERLCAAWAHDLESLLALDVPPRKKLEIHVRQIIRNYRRYPYTNRVMTELVTSSKPALAKRLSRNFVRPLVEFHERLIASLSRSLGAR